MNRILYASLLVLLMAGNVAAQSQPTPPTPTNANSEPKRSPADKTKPVIPIEGVAKNVASTPGQSVSVADKKRDTNDAMNEKTNSHWWVKSEWWMVIFSAALAIFALLQVRRMDNQEKWMRRNVEIATDAADTARRTVETMEDTAQRQLRAYVGIDSITMNKFGGPDAPEVHITFKNTGLTPAYIEKANTAILMREFPIKGDFPDMPQINSAIQTGQSVIGAGGVVHSIVPTARPLTPEENTSVRNGTGAIYAFGEMAYTDVFGVKRSTKFRSYYGGARERAPMV